MKLLCVLIGHKGVTKCKRCAFTFSLPKYPNPPLVPPQSNQSSLFGGGGGGFW